MDAVTALVGLLLPVQWQVIAVFAHDDLRDQARGGDAAFL